MLGEELTSSDRFAGGQFKPDLVAALFSAHLFDSKHLQVRMKCSTLSSPSLQRHSGLLACWIRFRKALSLVSGKQLEKLVRNLDFPQDRCRGYSGKKAPCRSTCFDGLPFFVP